ncbi:hypothetical protein OROMI_003873 [Orobanche minor]
MKIKNSYFPLFASPSNLQKERDHIEGFSTEVAWATKAGKTDLHIPLAIRPVCREFLWQEGHNAFSMKEEANAEVLEILELYRQIFAEYLTVPVIKGNTASVRSLPVPFTPPRLRHLLQTPVVEYKAQLLIAWDKILLECMRYTLKMRRERDYWCGRTHGPTLLEPLGVMVMVHGDDKGLMLILRIFDACSETVITLCEEGILAESDSRDNCSPGWKYSDWEMKGVPLRIEIGPRDLANNQL